LLTVDAIVLKGLSNQTEFEVAKKSKKKIIRREYTKADVKELRAHSKARTPLPNIMKVTKRTEGSLRQKALKLGISLGHRR
jgi:predicted methyltransferase